MMHELKNIIFKAYNSQKAGRKNVLATVVFLEGSSYRKPGVRMLICEDGSFTGAVSGGCVENEIQNRAESVFETGISRMMTYDGRYRLGCEGILYILLESFSVSDLLFQKFNSNIETRSTLQISSNYIKKDFAEGPFRSSVIFDDHEKLFFSEVHPSEDFEGSEVFTQKIEPCFKLMIIGGEHDAVKLCSMAALMGWEVEVFTTDKNPQWPEDFPGAKSVLPLSPERAVFRKDDQSAIILMTHNYALDLQYLLKLIPNPMSYIGIIGSNKRREHLFNEILEYVPDIDEAFFEKVHSPAGLNIGAETPEEIAVSVLAEILALRKKKRDLMININT